MSDQQERWEAFKAVDNRCPYCGGRLKWEGFQIRGVDGAWEMDQVPGEEQVLPVCYRCKNLGDRRPRLRVQYSQFRKG